MSFELPAQLTPDFAVRVQQDDARWVVSCSGTLDTSDAAAQVQPALLKLHEAVVAAKIPVVRLEVDSVEYMNSSGLKSFMAWFLTASNVKQDRYLIEVIFDPSRSWQQLSFKPMERLAPNSVKLVPRAA